MEEANRWRTETTVRAIDADRHTRYECPECGDAVKLYAGYSNAPHFRHDQTDKPLFRHCSRYQAMTGDNSVPTLANAAIEKTSAQKFALSFANWRRQVLCHPFRLGGEKVGTVQVTGGSLSHGPPWVFASQYDGSRLLRMKDFIFAEERHYIVFPRDRSDLEKRVGRIAADMNPRYLYNYESNLCAIEVTLRPPVDRDIERFYSNPPNGLSVFNRRKIQLSDSDGGVEDEPTDRLFWYTIKDPKTSAHSNVLIEFKDASESALLMPKCVWGTRGSEMSCRQMGNLGRNIGCSVIASDDRQCDCCFSIHYLSRGMSWFRVAVESGDQMQSTSRTVHEVSEGKTLTRYRVLVGESQCYCFNFIEHRQSMQKIKF